MRTLLREKHFYKTIFVFLVLSLLFAGFGYPARVKSETVKIEFTVGGVVAYVNGKPVPLDVPVIIDKTCNRTLVPLRFVSESFGATVQWNGKERKITIALPGKVINLFIGKKTALVNGSKVLLDCAPKILFSRTLVPIRFVSEVLGATVLWDGKERKVTILFEKTAPEKQEKTVKADERAVSFTEKTVKINSTDIKKVKFYIVKINLKGKNIRVYPYLSEGGPNTSESSRAFAEKIKPIAMVNGGTFDLKYFIPTGDIVREGIPRFIRQDGYEYRETMGVTASGTPFFADGVTRCSVVINGKALPLTSVNGMWHGTVKLYTNWYKKALNVPEDSLLLVVSNGKVLEQKSGTAFYPSTMDDRTYALLIPKSVLSEEISNAQVNSVRIKIEINGKDYSGSSFIKCGPLLLKNGKAYLDYLRYAYLNRTLKRGARSVLAFDNSGSMYFIYTPTPVRLSYGDLSVALEKLGMLSYAISLDGGGSTLLYYKGQFISKSGRKIVSVIAVPSEIPADKNNSGQP